VAAVLAAIESALPEADAEGKYLIDEPALDALEQALADADKAGKEKDDEIKALKEQLAAKDATIADKDAEIAALEAKPAAGNHQVVETGDQKPVNEDKSPFEALSETFANARKMMGQE
jgi:chromosome segregation ATPase